VTLHDAVRGACARLAAVGIEAGEAGRDAELLARCALGWDRASFLARAFEPTPSGFEQAYEALVARRARREPVAYIRGAQEFYGRDFAVSRAVLIPRPETELLVEEALSWLATHHARAIVDVGTGSGCVAITLACETGRKIWATDVSPAAIALARDNASAHGVEELVHCAVGAYLNPVEGPIDLVVANLPYVSEQDAACLPLEVAAYEPREALFGGKDGLACIRALAERAASRLIEGGALILEIGAGQDEAVRELVSGMPGMSLVRIRTDLQGIPRTGLIVKRSSVSASSVPSASSASSAA
jgi:release factor glutamine methyltransferase